MISEIDLLDWCECREQFTALGARDGAARISSGQFVGALEHGQWVACWNALLCSGWPWFLAVNHCQDRKAV